MVVALELVGWGLVVCGLAGLLVVVVLILVMRARAPAPAPARKDDGRPKQPVECNSSDDDISAMVQRELEKRNRF